MSFNLYNFTRAVSVTKNDTEYITNPAEPSTAALATGAVIVINNGKVTSVTLATAGVGYSAIGTLAFAISGGTGSGATLLPVIVGGSIQIAVTAGGSGYTDGVYTSGSTYTLGLTGSGTLSNNVIQCRPARIQVGIKVAAQTIKVLTPSGDTPTFTYEAVGNYILPIEVLQVFSTGTTATGEVIALW